ncbi:hypothetical protein P5P86_12765 [Nocardioides sp. BP30]|uniref:hypothetical protein n=1 Tax=Nocardioides sp. BP30 TaxID=3036374 RepID=UPI002468B5E1|nr:hypothetical protein [Nocardioides sp. BP30]WGL50835.1 hypothetical protein P5P86_12765 [Nocardioides sp. BP30]
MSPSTDHRIPQASLREEWSIASVQRLAWSMGRPADAVDPVRRLPVGLTSGSERRSPDPARRARRMEALARLAVDPQATPAERALAAQRLAALSAAAYATAC